MIDAREFKLLFSSMITGMIMIGYLVFVGTIETISIVLLTIIIYSFLKKRKNISFRYLSIVIVGIILGILLSSCGLSFLRYENHFKKETVNQNVHGNVAVLLVFSGEPERYDLPILLKNMYTDQLFRKITLPFQLHQYKRAYESIGMSSYDAISNRIALKLSYQLDEGYDIFIGYMNNKPYYREVMQGEIIGNYKNVIVAPVYLTESKDYTKIMHDLEMETFLIKDTLVKFIPPLWDSEKITKSVADNLCKISETYNSKEIGIVLTDQDFEKSNKKDLQSKIMNQERLFMERIKTLLIENNFESRKIKFASLHLGDSEIVKLIEELQEYGVTKIILVGINDISDRIVDRYRIKKLIHQLKLEETEVDYINGWGENDLVIDELEYRVRLLNVEGWR
jgi:uncharacterized membrane protein YwzB